MDTDLTLDAIKEAVKGNWEKAKKLNLEILKILPDDIDSLNRLARAMAELGDTKGAQKYTKKVLVLDPTNSIAANCIKKWKSFKPAVGKKNGIANGRNFLEIPGRTKLTKLINLGDTKTLAKLDCGDKVKLVSHPHTVAVTTLDSKYIGRLPDDLATKFIKLIKDGHFYEAYLKSAQINSVTVFIKERSSSQDTI